MTLRCVLFGHRRSRSLATYDEKRGRWISQCKRCHVMLEREDHKDWRPFEPASGTLEQLERAEVRPAPEEPAKDDASGCELAAPADEGPLIGAAHRTKPATRGTATAKVS